MHGLWILEKAGAQADQFIKFWSSRYRDVNEHFYDNGIERPLTAERAESLFFWKAGKQYWRKSKPLVQKNFISRLDELASLPSDITPDEFLRQFATGGAIWRIFWLHCWQPLQFPIYDQHVHRAMAVIETGQPEEITGWSDGRKIDVYLRRYVRFVARHFADAPIRSVDRALWTCGQFLKSRWCLA